MKVSVGIDALEKRNDALRGAGNFAAAMRALEIYYSVGFEPKVLVTVTSQSLPDLEELICLLIEKKLTRINLNGFRPIGRGRTHWELMVNPDDVRETLKRVRNAECGMRNDFFGDDNIAHDETQSETANAYTTTTPHSAFRTPHLNCGVGAFLNIMPNGDVFPCHVLTDREFRCGNLREQSLVEICSRNGLLGRLSALNFQELAKEDSRLSELKNRTVCLGNVYPQTRSLPVWQNSLRLN